MSDRYAKYDAFDIDYPADRVLRITFNNPKTYNSLDARGHNQITYIWKDIDLDPDVDAVIVTGAGKAFSSGGDFGMIDANINDETQRIQAWKEARDLVYGVIDCNKPVISAINGVAVGAGLVVAMLADISIAGKSARIVDGHVRLGVPAGSEEYIRNCRPRPLGRRTMPAPGPVPPPRRLPRVSPPSGSPKASRRMQARPWQGSRTLNCRM